MGGGQGRVAIWGGDPSQPCGVEISTPVPGSLHPTGGAVAWYQALSIALAPTHVSGKQAAAAPAANAARVAAAASVPLLVVRVCVSPTSLCCPLWLTPVADPCVRAPSCCVLAQLLSPTLQLLQVVADGAPHVTRVMLDNMTRLDQGSPCGVDVSLLTQAVGVVGGRLATEGSGNVTLATVAAIAGSGVDYVSVGALTHSVKALDISLNIVAK